MLTFLHPWAWGLALPAAWLVLRSLRPRTQVTRSVSNLLLWTDRTSAPAAAPDRGLRWRTLLQALILALAAAGAAGPEWHAAPIDAAIVIDAGRGMRATDGGGTRLDAARAAARAWLSERPANERVALFSTGSSTPIDIFRAGSAAGRRAVDAVTAVGPLAVADVLLAARQSVTGTIVVIAGTRAPAILPHDIEWRTVGTPVSNFAVTAIRSNGDMAWVELQNAGTAAGQVRLSIDAGPFHEVRNVKLQAGHVHREFLPVPADAVDVDARIVNSGDALPDDDRLRAAPAGERTLTIQCITPGSTAIDAALRSLPAVDIVVSPPGTAPSKSADIVVCDRCDRPPAEPAIWLPAHDATVTGTRRIVSAIPDHPLLADVELSDAELTPATRGVEGVPVIAAADVPLVTASDGGARRVTFNLTEETALTRRTAWPILLANAVDWVSRRDASTLTAEDVRRAADADLMQTASPPLPQLPAAATSQARSVGVWALVVAALLGAIELLSRLRPPVTRAIGVAALAAAAGGGHLPVGGLDRHVVFALDASDSVSPLRGQVSRWTSEQQSARSGDRASAIAFGASVVPIAPAGPPPLRGIALPAPSAATDIAAAIRAAGRMLTAAGDRRIVLVSDGQATQGDALPAAEESGRSGVPIDVVPLDPRTTPTVLAIDAPGAVPRQSAVPLRVRLAGPTGGNATMSLTRDTDVVWHGQVSFDDAGRASVSVTDAPTSGGLITYRASVTDTPSGIDPSSAAAVVATGGRRQVLVIARGMSAFASGLRQSGVAVMQMAPETAPSTRDGFAAASAAVLDGVGPGDLSPIQQRALVDAVSLDGMGLLQLGGRRALEPAAYVGSALAGALPVDLTQLPRPPAKSTALAILLDVSGSMSQTADGVEKIDVGRQAIRHALAVLPASTVLEILAFAATPSTVLPPDGARDPRAVDDRLAGLKPGGSTRLAPAVIAAEEWLGRTSAERKRIILISDGRAAAADIAAAVRAAREGPAEISTVAIGTDADEAVLTALARSTNGRTYFPATLDALPRAVAAEAARTAESREVEGVFRVAGGPHPLAANGVPPILGGYVAAELRRGADAPWRAPNGDAVLSAWPVGLGRAAVLATDVGGPWGAGLNNWSGAGAFWRRAIQWLARDADALPVDIGIAQRPDGARLIADVQVDARVADMTVDVLAPSGAMLALPLHAVSAGRFEARLPLEEVGTYRGTISAVDERGIERRAMRGWFWSGDREASSRGTDMATLRKIAAVSGGVVFDALRPGDAGEFALPRKSRGLPMTLPATLLASAVLAVSYIRAAGRGVSL